MTRESVPADPAKAAASFEPGEAFLAEYFAQVPPEDLRSYGPETLRARAAHQEWESGRREQLGRIKDTFVEVTRPGQVDLASISVALKLLRMLAKR